MFKIMLKRFFRFLIIFILACVIFYLGGEAGYQTKLILEQWKINKDLEQFNKAIEEMFREDIYGGKTPEETFNLFVEALKKEDIDLAVKYIVLDAERRERYWQEFNGMKEKGELKKYIESWPKWEDWEEVRDEYNDWEERAEVWYAETLEEPMIIYDPYLKKETEIQPGTYLQQDIIFIKNINDIWKISNL